MALLLRKNVKPSINEIMFGAAPIGGLFTPIPMDVARGAVRRAYERGVRLFDTAPLYGAGQSEDAIGLELGDKPDVKIYTKVGRVVKRIADITPEDNKEEGFDHYYKVDRDTWPVFDYTAAGVRAAHAGSVERLRGAKIVCQRVHDAETEERYQAAIAGGAVDELVKMRTEGTIKDVSLGFNTPSFLLRFIRHYPQGTFNVVMNAGSWNLLDQSSYDLLCECQANGIRVTNAGVFGSGILWGGTTLRYAKAPTEAHELAGKWAVLAQKYNVSLPAVALKFALLPQCVDAVAIGCRSEKQVDDNLALLEFDVPDALFVEAQKEGLLPAHIQLPM
eukprot:TRINITY_DN13671_c0_g1_i1.p1 TRINITY_DN13671_c0_g1~~TRINITY_DN13671_c0_g1_i1.p1  ORF type:complete len:333 (+),score=102.25 TRINITY_DN13671_c0_g1_i1:53-1051(+)